MHGHVRLCSAVQKSGVTDEDEAPIRRYEVWCEGFRCNGYDEPARKVGGVDARSFQQACYILLANDQNYDRHGLSTWGCRLFDNEAEARRSFG